MKTRIVILMFSIVFSSSFVGIAHGSIFLDKDVYTWTDKIHIRITEHGVDAANSSVRIYTSDHALNNYKLAKAGNGLYTGEVILTGFLHDVDGDGNPDTNPRTTGSGPNNGFLEAKLNRGFTISVEFGDGDVISKSAKIHWNEGNISFDTSNYSSNESVKLQVTDVDMNLNPETLDVIKIHVFSDSDKAGVIVDAIETQEESGLFESIVSFTQDSPSSGNRLFAVSGDMIYAQYDDYTLPVPYNINDHLEIIAELALNSDGVSKTVIDKPEIINESLDSPIPEPEQDIPVYQNCGSGTTLQDGICVADKTKENPTDTSVCWGGLACHYGKPPLKQFKSGIPTDEIQCRDLLILVTKHDGSPACVKPETTAKLIERGWEIGDASKFQEMLEQLRDDPQDVSTEHAELIKGLVVLYPAVSEFLEGRTWEYTCCGYLLNEEKRPDQYKLVINFFDYDDEKQLAVIFDLETLQVVRTQISDVVRFQPFVEEN